MKRLLKTFEYYWDYYFVVIFFNGRQICEYHEFMYKKWGSRYCSEEEIKIIREDGPTL